MAKIVYAEDDSSLREGMSEFLNYTGHETLSVENGLKALNMIRQGGIDLLITDGDMPEMTGFELISNLSKEKITIPVLMLSGANIDMMYELLLQTMKDYPGKALYHSKPPQIKRLTSQINLLLNPINLPEYGIYTNHDNFCSIAFEELTKIKKNTAIKEQCLCKYTGQITRTAISHPCDTNECMNAIRTITQENPQTQFYIITLGKERETQIGCRHNVVYITNENAKQKFIEILQRPTDQIPKQIQNQ